MAEVSATAEPETPEMSMLATTVTYPSPPRTWPHMALATMMIRSEMPPVFMISPASRKNGIAMSGKLSMPRKMLWMTRAGDQAPMGQRQDQRREEEREGNRHRQQDEAEQRREKKRENAHGCTPFSARMSAMRLDEALDEHE